MIKSIIKICFVILVFASCRKHKVENSVTPSNEFIKNNIVNVQSIRLFTKQGEMLDPVIIQKYMQETTFSNYIIQNNDKKELDGFTEFSLVGDTILTKLGYPSYSTKRKQIDIFDRFATNSIYSSLDTNMLDLNFSKYKKIYVMQLSNGQPIFEIENQQFLCKRKADSLVFPQFRLLYFSRQEQNHVYYFSSSIVNNELNSQGFNKLGNLDTVIIQRFDVLLKRK